MVEKVAEGGGLERVGTPQILYRPSSEVALVQEYEPPTLPCGFIFKVGPEPQPRSLAGEEEGKINSKPEARNREEEEATSDSRSSARMLIIPTV